jgi:hypothetical protein
VAVELGVKVEVKVLVAVGVGVLVGGWGVLVNVGVEVGQTTVMAMVLLVTGPPPAHWAIPRSLTTWQASLAL